MIERFINDDTGYLNWVSNNPLAYVVNCERNPRPAYLILHRVDCHTINELPFGGQVNIISPVKIQIPEGIIEEYQSYEMERKVYKYIPKEWVKEIKLFTENEFTDYIIKNGRRIEVPSIEINKKYNNDEFDARDGRWVKACDDLAAFSEAYLALRHGVTFQILHDAKYIIRNKYNQKEYRNIAGINFAQLYADYDE